MDEDPQTTVLFLSFYEVGEESWREKKEEAEAVIVKAGEEWVSSFTVLVSVQTKLYCQNVSNKVMM